MNVTFPSSRLTERLEEVALKDYGLEASARLAGTTLGIMAAVPRIGDLAGDADQELVRKVIGDLVFAVTRAALSTDADVRFVVAVVRGAEDQNEVRITRNVADIKKAQTEALSVEESLNRTLWDQARYQPDPVDLSHFTLHELTMEEFLQKQIVQRVRFLNQNKAGQNVFLPTELIDGRFQDAPEGRLFEFSIVSFESVAAELNVLKVLRVVNEVFGGYGFRDFDLVVIKDLLSRKMLIIDRHILEEYQHKRVGEDEILRLGFRDDMSESDRLRNALEIFGFNFQS